MLPWGGGEGWLLGPREGQEFQHAARGVTDQTDQIPNSRLANVYDLHDLYDLPDLYDLTPLYDLSESYDLSDWYDQPDLYDLPYLYDLPDLPDLPDSPDLYYMPDLYDLHDLYDLYDLHNLPYNMLPGGSHMKNARSSTCVLGSSHVCSLQELVSVVVRYSLAENGRRLPVPQQKCLHQEELPAPTTGMKNVWSAKQQTKSKRDVYWYI